jgi:hypothetical protein
LDYGYSSHSNIPNILKDFASQCVQAAQMKAEYCYFGQNSLSVSDPASDLYQRINYVVGNLTAKSYTDPTNGSPYNLMALASVVRDSLVRTSQYPALAQYFMDAEYVIQKKNQQDKDNEYLTIINNNNGNNTDTETTTSDPSDATGNVTVTASYNRADPFYGDMNSFLWPAVVCLDQNLANNTLDWFVDKWHGQVLNNSLVGYMSKPLANCVAWPNLTDYDVERVHPEDFPKQLKNKMLVIGVTDDPVTPYHSALNTYNLIGANNSEFLVHDGMGHCTLANPNACTTAAIKAYFVNGMSTSCTTLKQRYSAKQWDNVRIK